ncbi:Tyrosine-sulfated glycopeptide receptor 1 [Morella rubra]|uniref:Tyrosine-sulfated glycopeptide receptor 1 n=1 Tax=Morella rubra TaxID=262757 RepID=A0A6A1WVW6_9ROSI|nr:Tyrosine-sulfated glycopeptide receptor 1 [Morella rubra]
MGRFLDFSFNHYSGQIPSGLGGCSKLEVFRAGFNSLSGPLPLDIYSATRLQEISYLPIIFLDSLARHRELTRLAKLELYRNNIGGKLPGNIGKLSQLEHLLLHKNSFIGALPPSLMNFTNLIKLNLAFNFFEGDISTLNFSSLSQLVVLDLGFNNFTGNLPTSLYSCKFLRAIRLANNQLEGEIKIDMVQLKFLSFLSLSESRLTNITKAIKILMHCKALNILFLPSNFLQEAMPTDDSIFSSNGFTNLQLLSFSYCQLTGQLPIWLSKLKNLEVLLLNGNRMSGSIPGWLSTLPRLFILDLDGKIPDQISDLTNLEILDLSANQLTGEIPASLANLHFLNTFSIASNKLHGPIPSGTQLQSFDASDYEGNPGLCGPPLPNQCPDITDYKGDRDIHDEQKGHAVPWLYISMVLGFITGFWGVCGL